MSSCKSDINADLLIINGIVYDGINSESKVIDIAIKDAITEVIKIITENKSKLYTVKRRK